MNFLQDIQFKIARAQLASSRADFYYDLATSLEDRVPIFTTLRKYEARARARGESSRHVYARMLQQLETGSVASALGIIASTNERIMIESVISSGDAGMAQGLRFLSEQVEKTNALSATMKKAVTYPIIMLIVFSCMFVGFSLFVVPTLASVFPPKDWPILGRMLFAVSQFIKHWGIYLGIAIVTVFMIFMKTLPSWTSPLRRKLDTFLPYSLYRDYCGAMLLVSLASMMRSGVSLRSAIERSITQSDQWLRWHLHQILVRLTSQDATFFGQAFQTGLLQQSLEDRVVDASERQNPIESFVKIGVGSIDKLIASIEKSAARLNSMMLVVCGLTLMFMLGGFLSTALEIQSAVTKQMR